MSVLVSSSHSDWQSTAEGDAIAAAAAGLLAPGSKRGGRTLDLVLAAVGLVVASPVLAVAALAIKFTSRGPAFFRQRRVGLDGRSFTLLKLRTMHVGGDDGAYRALVVREMTEPDAASAPTLASLVPRTPRLEVLAAGDHRTVFLNGHLIARFACGDRGTERVVVTQLADVLPLADRDIARAFDLHPVTLSRYRGQLHHGGAAALMPRRTGPKGPSKMTPRLAARCRQLRLEGRSVRDIAVRVSRPDRTISHVTVAEATCISLQ